MIRCVKTLKGRRGNITDRNGQLIATDSYLSNVGVVPGKLEIIKKKV